MESTTTTRQEPTMTHSIMTAMPERASDIDVLGGIATSLNDSGCTQQQIVRYLTNYRPRALAATAAR